MVIGTKDRTKKTTRRVRADLEMVVLHLSSTIVTGAYSQFFPRAKRSSTERFPLVKLIA